MASRRPHSDYYSVYNARWRGRPEAASAGNPRRFLSASDMEGLFKETDSGWASTSARLSRLSVGEEAGVPGPSPSPPQRPSASPPPRNPSHHARLGDRIHEMYRTGDLVDVRLRCGVEEIGAHRLVLAAASDYFAAMFSSGLSESSQQMITIKDIEPKSLRALIDFCYTGEIKVTEDNVQGLFSGANMIRLSKVEEECGDFLSEKLTPVNALGIRGFADLHRNSRLKDQALQYIKRNFMSVSGSEEFLGLAASELGPLLSSDELNVESELDVFSALMAWFSLNPGRREAEMGRLVQTIRLVFLPRDVLAELADRYPLFRDNAVCHELYVDGLKAHLSPDKAPRLKPRKSTLGTLFALGGQDHSKGPMSIERYDIRADRWVLVGRMSGRRQQFGVAVLQDRVFVVGGRDGLKTLNCFESWEPSSAQWSFLPNMSTARHGLAVAVLGGPLYAVGGHDGWSYLSSVERWDPETRLWAPVASMKAPRSTAAVAVLNGRLYVAGGRDHSHPLDSLETYNPHTDSWTTCAHMHHRRSNLGLCAANGFLWAIGGVEIQPPSPDPPTSRLASLEKLDSTTHLGLITKTRRLRYDPETDMWTLVPGGMSVGREGMGVGVLGDSLFAVGGYDGSRFLRIVEALDLNTNTWTKASELVTGRTGAGIAILPRERECSLHTPKIE